MECWKNLVSQSEEWLNELLYMPIVDDPFEALFSNYFNNMKKFSHKDFKYETKVIKQNK